MRRRVSSLLVLALLGSAGLLGSAAGFADEDANRGRKRVKSWMVLLGEDATVTNGSVEDVERIRKLRLRSDEDLVWFRHGGTEYLVRDPALVREAKELLAPQMELGARQGELGAQQGKLGAEQGRLGARLGELGARQGTLAAGLAVRRVRDGEMADGTSLAREERRIEAEMEQLGEEMEAVGEEMEPLSREMERLGEQMEALGSEMERLSERAGEQLGELFQRALASGAARPLRQGGAL